MLGSTKAASALEQSRTSSLAEVSKSTTILTPSSGTTHQPSTPQFTFGRLSQHLIDSSKAQSFTSERPKSVLDEVRTSSSSSTSHQSSQQFRFGPYTAHPPLQTRGRRDPAEGKVTRLRLKRPESKPWNPDSTC